MQSQTVTLPGINIQAPWAEAIVAGHKVIETRCYPQPLPPGFRAGIRYARAVEILRPSAALLARLAR